MKSALLFRLGGLGDLLVAFPAVHLLRTALSPCSITLVCRQEYGALLREAGVVDTILREDDPLLAPLFAPPPYPPATGQWLSGFSYIVSWMQREGSLQVENFCGVRPRARCQSVIADPDSNTPLSFYFYKRTSDFLFPEGFHLPSYSECCLLPLSPEQKQEGLKLLGGLAAGSGGKIAVIHPGSGSERKCWPLGNFLGLIRRLSRLGYCGALVTGPAEERLEQRISASKLPRGWVWLKNTPPLPLAGLLASSSLFVGNDSGITHLAAASGASVVALFRSDLERHWKPCGRSSVLSADEVSEISPDSVWAAVSEIAGS